MNLFKSTVVCAAIFSQICGGCSDNKQAMPTHGEQEGSEVTAVSNFEYAKKYAESGDPEMQGVLGVMFLKGVGVKRDLKQARKWLRTAAINGDAYAQFYLGLVLISGEDEPENIPEGVKYFRMAAEQGYSDAQGILAMAYRDGGKGLAPDPIQAFTWFSVLVMNDNDEHMQWQEQKRMVAKDLSQEQLAAAEEKAAQLFRQHGSGKWFDE